MVETATAPVEVSNISNAHVHVKTLHGEITITTIRTSHLDVHSVSGDISLHDVTKSSVQVHSGTGRVIYEGDPGPTGEYVFTSHSGDLDVSIPANVSGEIKAHSLKGSSDGEPPPAGSALREEKSFLKPGIFNRPLFVLRSFKGRIHLKRP